MCESGITSENAAMEEISQVRPSISPSKILLDSVKENLR
jgi:hypothetical protein